MLRSTDAIPTTEQWGGNRKYDNHDNNDCNNNDERDDNDDNGPTTIAEISFGLVDIIQQSKATTTQLWGKQRRRRGGGLIYNNQKRQRQLWGQQKEEGVAHGINIIARAAGAEMGGSSGAMARGEVRS